MSSSEASGHGHDHEPGAGDEGFWSQRNVRIAAGVGVAVVFIGGLTMRFDGPLTLPGKPPPPPPADKDRLRRMDFENPDIYKGYLEADSQLYGVDLTRPEDLAEPFPYEKSEAVQTLDPGGKIETSMLRISLRSQRMDVQKAKGKARTDVLILRIENKTDKHVAYSVQTQMAAGDEGCTQKPSMYQNAIALPPGGAVERSECFERGRNTLRVTSIEAMQIPALSFYYASRIYPPHLGILPRISDGHAPPKGELCQTMPQQLIVTGIQNGTVSWRDVVDYYARHRCETYDFPIGYRAISKPGQYKLPVSASTLEESGP